MSLTSAIAVEVAVLAHQSLVNGSFGLKEYLTFDVDLLNERWK
jgi:hypothetical protein